MQHLPRGCGENFQLVRNDQRIWTLEVHSEMQDIQGNLGLNGLYIASGKCRCWWNKKACGSLVYTEESLLQKQNTSFFFFF
jgi:hypothetical protein